jgi:hypothetical protein
MSLTSVDSRRVSCVVFRQEVYVLYIWLSVQRRVNRRLLSLCNGCMLLSVHQLLHYHTYFQLSLDDLSTAKKTHHFSCGICVAIMGRCLPRMSFVLPPHLLRRPRVKSSGNTSTPCSAETYHYLTEVCLQLFLPERVFKFPKC